MPGVNSFIIGMGMLVTFAFVMLGIALYSDHKEKLREKH